MILRLLPVEPDKFYGDTEAIQHPLSLETHGPHDDIIGYGTSI